MGLPATAGSSRHKGARGYALALGTQSPISKGGLMEQDWEKSVLLPRTVLRQAGSLAHV